jgi:tRNA-dihydrouridine synthase B
MQPWTSLPKPILALAPMAGISTSAFRQICYQHGADVTFTPLLSAEGIVREQHKSLEMLTIYPEEGPVVVQLFGKNPESVGRAAKMAQEAGAVGVDLNLGCPARKIVKQGIGVALAEDLNLCHEVLAAICANVTVPVSLKIRAWARCHTREGFVTGTEIVERMRDLPIACITVHGRGTENPFGGEVNLELIEAVKKQHTGLVLANGSIVDGPSAKKALDATNADGVAIARGSWGKPWVFNEIKAYLSGQKFTEPTTNEVRQTIIEHAELSEQRGGRTAVIEARKHFLWYARYARRSLGEGGKGWPDSASLRQQLSQATSAADVEGAVR